MVTLLINSLVMGLALTSGRAAEATEVKDCCAAKLACCSPASACCAATTKLGCCAKGQKCCEEDRACCSAAQACCTTGEKCCDEGKACCGPAGKDTQAAAKPACCSATVKTVAFNQTAVTPPAAPGACCKTAK
jgi:hypothetical protein